MTIVNKGDENGDTIRDIAVRILENKQKSGQNEDNTSRCIFVMGNKSSGKSTLINMFLEKEENISETFGLDYTFGRKNVQGHLNEKHICHVWELGGDMFKTSDIMSVPFRAHRSCPMTIVIFLDLTQPKLIWSTLENCIENLRSLIEKLEILKKKDDQIDTLFSNDNEIFPLPLIIIGGKYELFNELDINFKKPICKALRSAACILGASLIFFSKSDQAVKRRLKEVLNNVGFGTESKIKGTIQDINKPLFIPAGSDSWESIGIGKSNWSDIRTTYTMQFPQTHSSTIVPEDPSLEAIYREPLVDSMRNQREEELKLILNKNTLTNF